LEAQPFLGGPNKSQKPMQAGGGRVSRPGKLIKQQTQTTPGTYYRPPTAAGMFKKKLKTLPNRRRGGGRRSRDTTRGGKRHQGLRAGSGPLTSSQQKGSSCRRGGGYGFGTDAEMTKQRTPRSGKVVQSFSGKVGAGVARTAGAGKQVWGGPIGSEVGLGLDVKVRLQGGGCTELPPHGNYCTQGRQPGTRAL